MKIKIDLTTLRGNPEAGQTTTLMQGASSCEVTILYTGKTAESGAHVPELEEKSRVIQTTRSKEANQPKEVEICYTVLGNPNDIIKSLQKYGDHEKIKVQNISIDNTMQFVNHSPKPKYLFSYENPLIECASCRCDVEANSIIVNYQVDETGEEVPYETCPVCRREDTFPSRENESISEALERQKGNMINQK